MFCKELPAFATRVADVLWQLLQTGHADERKTVQEALLTTFLSHPASMLAFFIYFLF